MRHSYRRVSPKDLLLLLLFFFFGCLLRLIS